MKINLPSEVIMDCMQNSEKFRRYVTSLVCYQDNKQQIESVFVHLIRSNQKIAAIKALREYSFGNKDRLDAIKSCYPAEYGDYGTSDNMLLSLASAKKIVELYQ